MSLVLYEVEQHPLFPTLTDKQKSFVRNFVELGEGVAAVVKTYGSVRRPQAVCARMLRNENIRQVLKLTGDMPAPPLTRAEFARLLSKHMREANAKTFIGLSKVYENLQESKGTKSKKAAAKSLTVDDLVLQMEKERGQ